MISERELFGRHIAQTSPFPISLEIKNASGCYLFSESGKKYIDLISGISVSNLGHCHPKIVGAVHDQVEKYMHLMVYGEYVQSPQVKLAGLLTSLLPESLDNVYFVNSGSEAIEGAMKLAKRHTGRKRILSFNNSYHGSTQGSLSLMGDNKLKNTFYPLLPDIAQLNFNKVEDLKLITSDVAAVFVEPIQGEAGVILPQGDFLLRLRKRCDETKTLLVFDEIQTGYGRTGKLFAFEHFGIIPDILCLAKAMGGGMPLGAFISSRKIMSELAGNPELGHITTFGGHPVCCAAGYAALQVLLDEKIMDSVKWKHDLFLSNLKHKHIREVRGQGLLLAIEFDNFELNKKLIGECLKSGLIVDWFLFNMKSMRIAPPLIIEAEEIVSSCRILIDCLNKIEYECSHH